MLVLLSGESLDSLLSTKVNEQDMRHFVADRGLVMVCQLL